MTIHYKQCVMRKLTPDGLAIQEFHTAWIPEEFAKKGKIVDFLDSEGWDKGWEIMQVGTRMSEEYVRDHENDHKTQSTASDKFTPNKGLGIPK